MSNCAAHLLCQFFANSHNLNLIVKPYSVEILERKWKFKLGEEFTTTFGKDLGNSLITCSKMPPNALRCEEHHEKHLSWRVITTFEFYDLGLIRDRFKAFSM